MRREEVNRNDGRSEADEMPGFLSDAQERTDKVGGEMTTEARFSGTEAEVTAG